MEDIKRLSDKELLARTAQVALRERKVTLELMRYLGEVDRRQLYLEQGYPSLYDFTIKDLKVSQGGAYRRLQAMRLLRELPEIESKVVEGKHTVSTVAKVQSAMGNAPPEDKLAMLKKLEGKSCREVDRELSRSNPKGPREYTRWLNPDEAQLTFALDKDSMKKIGTLHSWRTHIDVKKTYRVLFTALVDLGMERWNPARRTQSSTSRTDRVNPDFDEENSPDSIPAEIRRQVWERDKHQCTWAHPENGRRCDSTDLLQIDHIHPLALGGKNELSNLRLLCAQHNRARAEKTYGPVH